MTHDRHLILSVYDVIRVNTGQEDIVPTGVDDTDMFPRQDKQSTGPLKEHPKKSLSKIWSNFQAYDEEVINARE